MEDGIWDMRRAPGAAIFHLPSSIFSSLATRRVERNAKAMQEQSADKSAHHRIFEGNRCGDKKNRPCVILVGDRACNCCHFVILLLTSHCAPVNLRSEVSSCLSYGVVEGRHGREDQDASSRREAPKFAATCLVDRLPVGTEFWQG